MIHVPRGPAPRSLDGEASKGAAETRKAIAARDEGRTFDYKVYKEADISVALRAMFNKKCAYCEFNYAAGLSEDIEHFRPKGGVVVGEDLEKPGYYWLGAEWTNLLPSCPDCNRKRTKHFVDGTTDMSGKANLFPVSDELRRWRDHAVGCEEEPLLLDPCVDRPEEHLEFAAHGGLMRARPDAAGTPSRKGEASIKVYGLLRADLVEQRAAKQTLVRAAIERARKLSDKAATTLDPDMRDWLDGQAREMLEEARMHIAPIEPFRAAMDAVFDEYGLE